MSDKPDEPVRLPCYEDLDKLIATNAAVRSFVTMARTGILTREQALVGCVLHFADVSERLQKQVLEAMRQRPWSIPSA